MEQFRSSEGVVALKAYFENKIKSLQRPATYSERLKVAPPGGESQRAVTSPGGETSSDMLRCGACEESARQSARLAGQLRDARDQLELMEFRLLELEDARHQGARDILTDSDSGCVSPGSRLKDSASPELLRMDSGYKSPGNQGSPFTARRVLDHELFRREFAEAQALSDALDGGCGLAPARRHLEHVLASAACPQDRACLLRALQLLHDQLDQRCPCPPGHDSQMKTKTLSDLKLTKSETDSSFHKPLKATATVSPYSLVQDSRRGSVESVDRDEHKPVSALQESGIFEQADTESIGTQTDTFDFDTGELNTEIQTLNSIREKLERQGKERNIGIKEDGEEVEGRCTELGEKHKQYYERRLRYLEGKVSLYEAQPDVRSLQLARRLQREFHLENRILELEEQLSKLQDKYETLEEECCELEEIENDTRLHWQQLEMEYELCSVQLRDLTEQRAHADTLLAQLRHAHAREIEMMAQLVCLQRWVPALIAWNLLRAGAPTLCSSLQRVIPFNAALLSLPAPRDVEHSSDRTASVSEDYLLKLKDEEQSTEDVGNIGKDGAWSPTGDQPRSPALPGDHLTLGLQLEKEAEPVECELKSRVVELERRERAYLDMLSQADEMWADMEHSYKTSIEEARRDQLHWIQQVDHLTAERNNLKITNESLRTTLKEIKESESALRIALDKCERDVDRLESLNAQLVAISEEVTAQCKRSEAELGLLDTKFKKETDELRKVNKRLSVEMERAAERARSSELEHARALHLARRELARSYKTNQDLETTHSELKEEVESLEKQLSFTQRALSQTRKKCDDKVKTLSHELSIKTEELEDLRSETMRRSLRASRLDLTPERAEYAGEGRGAAGAARCSCPALRTRLVAQLVDDVFERAPPATAPAAPAAAPAAPELDALCRELHRPAHRYTQDTKDKITNYLLMAISRELVRSIGDADAKTDTEEWRRGAGAAGAAGWWGGGDNAGVLSGAERLASVACACAAARLCAGSAAPPHLARLVNACQQEVLDHSDVKIMEEQLANAIESIVNCPSCALGNNEIVWSTDV